MRTGKCLGGFKIEVAWSDLCFTEKTLAPEWWIDLFYIILLYYIIIIIVFIIPGDRSRKQGEQLEAFTVTGQDILVLSITWLHPSFFLSLFLSSRDFWGRKMHIPHLHSLPHDQLCATVSCSRRRLSTCCWMNYKPLHVKAQERFLYICLSYISCFVCPIIKTQTCVLGVE